MKKNFLVTTGLMNAWEFDEKNYLLGKWCEFYEVDNYDKKKDKSIKLSETDVTKNKNHWDDKEKKLKDLKNIVTIIDTILPVISEKLSKVHDVNETEEYWHHIIHPWLKEYTYIMFDRWQHIKIFFEGNKNKKFYTNVFPLNNLDYITENHFNFMEITQTHEWNHLVFSRLIDFCKFKNLSIVKKKYIENEFNKNKNNDIQTTNFLASIFRFIDNIVAKVAIQYNEIIFERFTFPNIEYLKICLKLKQIPCKYLNFFNIKIKEKNFLNGKKRNEIKNLSAEINNNDSFIQFLLLNLYKDIPLSYVENFEYIKNFYLPYIKKKKIIFSMSSILVNDNFKIFVAESKKIGSKLIISEHGANLYSNPYQNEFDWEKKFSHRKIEWDYTVRNDNVTHLSPTLPVVKFKKKIAGIYCGIIFVEQSRYLLKFPIHLCLKQSIDFFYDLTDFVGKLNPDIKSKVKFRVKENRGFNAGRKFSEIFGKESIDKISSKNPFTNTLLNSKLIIATYPQTAFAEAMFSNVPTILVINKKHYEFSKEKQHIFDILKANQIAFEDFNSAKEHVNKYWYKIDVWWKNEDVQRARKMYLKSFFNVKPNWYKEWSDYIYSLKKNLNL